MLSESGEAISALPLHLKVGFMSARVLCAIASLACLLSSCAGRRIGRRYVGLLLRCGTGHRCAGEKGTAGSGRSDAGCVGGINNPAGLSGRTIEVASIADLKLRDKEVVLTFDDGPMPKKTERILATLDEFGVKGTFLMVGEMAKAHPDIAMLVARSGHTIGSHTYRHPNLRSLSFDAAVEEIEKGKLAVSRATNEEVGFFRFPYLADSSRLRSWLRPMAW